MVELKLNDDLQLERIDKYSDSKTERFNSTEMH